MQKKQIIDSAMGKGHTVATTSDTEFGTDFVVRRRHIIADSLVLRALARKGRLNIGRIQSITAMKSLPCAEALARLAENGLITMRYYPETGYSGALIDLMPASDALEKVRLAISMASRPSSQRLDVEAFAMIQERIDALEADDNAPSIN